MSSSRWRRRASGVAGACLLALGGTILTVGATTPNTLQQAWGTVRALAVTAPQTLSGILPEVTLGASGAEKELDACDGTFTLMLGYDTVGAPAVWAAHNNCGGDAILPWCEGQQFRIDGILYRVVDIRHVPKFTGKPDDLVGLRGDLALQTCLYGEPIVAFVGTERVPEAPVEASGDR